MKLLFRLLLFLFVLFVPTQLAYHFWPDWSLLFGIRVDYLSPKIYFTDLIFILLLGTWLFSGGATSLVNFIKKHKFLVVISLAFIFLNITNSLAPYPSLFKWIKILEMSLVVLMIKKRVSMTDIVTPLTLAVIVITLLGIAQFVIGKNLGGFFYWVGERNIAIGLPGISTHMLFGEEKLRAYSTFSHPNSFAGFLLVAAILISYNTPSVRPKFVILFLSTLSLLFAYSRAIFLAITFLTAFFLKGFKEIFLNQRTLVTILGVITAVSLVSPFIANNLFLERVSSESIRERLVLLRVSRTIIYENIVLGVGANNFVISAKNEWSPERVVWDFQPVHNTILLIVSEIGILGLSGFLLLFKKALVTAVKNKKTFLVLSLLVILITGSLDHYWLTLQQNELLFSFVLGLSLKEKSEF